MKLYLWQSAFVVTIVRAQNRLEAIDVLRKHSTAPDRLWEQLSADTSLLVELESSGPPSVVHICDVD
jgi:hypothetical protein